MGTLADAMGGIGLGKSGMTLAPVSEGHAGLWWRTHRHTLRRASLVIAASAAFVTGLSAMSAALVGEADPGVVPGVPGQPVVAVSPTGFGWREGIRAGQIVVDVAMADDPGGWRIDTMASDGPHWATSAEADAGLRASLALSIGSLLAGSLALVLFGSSRQWVLPVAALGLALGSAPLEIAGNPGLSTFAMGAAAIVPTVWAATRVPTRVAIVAATFAAAAIGYWAVARLNGLPGVDALEWIRGNVVLAGVGLLFLDRTILPRLAGEPLHVTRPRLLDVLALAFLAGIAFVLVYYLSLPALVVAALAVLIVMALPALRRRLRPVEDALLADVRRSAAVQGAEQERARLARDLHDVPLQELTAILRRLEGKAGNETEADDLRAVTGHLRNVAMDLRPPVLDDLGLPAGLEYLAEEMTDPHLPIALDLDDQTGVSRADRPPEEVELALFRITAEALENAVRHAAASRIEIEAHIAPRRVDLEIRDDGIGIGPAVMRGVRGKHMGLASMRRRAEAIDAEFFIRRLSPGTAVQVVWEA